MDVRLRPVDDDDLAVLYAQQLDPEATAMAGFPARDEDAFRAHWAGVLADDSAIAAVAVVDGRVAGNLVCWRDGGRRSIGYWFGRAFWGRGIATTALRLFLAEIADRPLYAHVAAGNLGSMRVLEKCGFLVAGDEEDGEISFELR